VAQVKVSALDRSMGPLDDVPPAVWGRAAWVTVIGTIAILVVTEGGVALWGHLAGHPLDHIAADLVAMAGEAGILATALYGARGVRSRAGSWYAALGLARPRRRDVG
jgi:hypothetical protein